MAESGQHHMLKAVQLLLDALVNPLIAVTKNIGPPGANGIQIAVAVKIFQPDSLGLTNRNQRLLLVILHLRTWVPEYFQIALQPVCVGSHGYSYGMRANQSRQ